MISFVRALVWLPLAGGAAPALAAPPAVSDAWIRATPPGAVTAAAYLSITSPAADRLVGAATPAAHAVEIHTNAVERGTQRMVRLAELTLPAGEALRLEPGGLHLMLIDLVQPLKPGTKVVLSLRFAEAGTVEIEAPVVDARAGAPLTHAGH
ncbi:MAG TPA: copper chaperone PCu(A)C [Gammaproteobacteria bacterium]